MQESLRGGPPSRVPRVHDVPREQQPAAGRLRGPRGRPRAGGGARAAFTMFRFASTHAGVNTGIATRRGRRGARETPGG